MNGTEAAESVAGLLPICLAAVAIAPFVAAAFVLKDSASGFRLPVLLKGDERR